MRMLGKNRPLGCGYGCCRPDAHQGRRNIVRSNKRAESQTVAREIRHAQVSGA